MRRQTIQNIITRAQADILSAYRQAKTFSTTSKSLADSLNIIFDSLPKTLPQKNRSFLMGFSFGIRETTQNEKRFMYNVNGVLYGTDKKLPDYYAANGITCAQLQKSKNGFYWSHSLKPFFID